MTGVATDACAAMLARLPGGHETWLELSVALDAITPQRRGAIRLGGFSFENRLVEDGPRSQRFEREKRQGSRGWIRLCTRLARKPPGRIDPACASFLRENGRPIDGFAVSRDEARIAVAGQDAGGHLNAVKGPSSRKTRVLPALGVEPLAKRAKAISPVDATTSEARDREVERVRVRTDTTGTHCNVRSRLAKKAQRCRDSWIRGNAPGGEYGQRAIDDSPKSFTQTLENLSVHGVVGSREGEDSEPREARR